MHKSNAQERSTLVMDLAGTAYRVTVMQTKSNRPFIAASIMHTNETRLINIRTCTCFGPNILLKKTSGAPCCCIACYKKGPTHRRTHLRERQPSLAITRCGGIRTQYKQPLATQSKVKIARRNLFEPWHCNFFGSSSRDSIGSHRRGLKTITCH